MRLFAAAATACNAFAQLQREFVIVQRENAELSEHVRAAISSATSSRISASSESAAQLAQMQSAMKTQRAASSTTLVAHS